MAQLILDGLLLLSLIVLLFSVPRWLRKIETLQRLKGDMEALSLQFVRATSDAALAIEELKNITTAEQQVLQQAQKKALATADDLDLLRKRAEHICVRLEQLSDKMRSPSTAQTRTQPQPTYKNSQASKAETDLMEAMRGNA